jgi:mono/diheme cytochrome c family protein
LVFFKRQGWQRTAKVAIITLLVAGVLGLLGLVALIRSGWYDVSALGQHWQLSYTTMERAMRYSVQHHARTVTAPPFTQEMLLRGATVYREQCVQCHGAPGIAPDSIGLSLQPLPGPLVHMTRRWKTEEIYWIISNGIKMSGMPAWRYRLSADELWAVTAMVTRLPALSVRDYAALQEAAKSAPKDSDSASAAPVERPIATNIQRGKLAIPQYACQSCHRIPGIVGASVRVGPDLDRYETHLYVAGYLPNSTANLARWLRETHQVKPQSAMPELGVSERDAADIAAYLLAGDLRK